MLIIGLATAILVILGSIKFRRLYMCLKHTQQQSCNAKNGGPWKDSPPNSIPQTLELTKLGGHFISGVPFKSGGPWLTGGGPW